MSAWLDPLCQVLDEVSGCVELFFRDDDGGWRDDRLFLLLDLFDRYSVPVDLAVIPAELTKDLACKLRRRAEKAPKLLAFHQHGWTHLNHEGDGRKCEFGPSRPKDKQYIDLVSGKMKLEELLDCPAEIFTPPWNRCTEVTAECLTELGFHVVSRDRTAAPPNFPGLVEMPVHVDWFAKRKGARLSFQQLGQQIAEALVERRRVGIMLHHGVMDETELVRLAQLLALLSAHANAGCLLMKTLATDAGQLVKTSCSGGQSGVDHRLVGERVRS